ncbi:hypothetical protein GZ77_12810 [Endozoicomonas montiporae]|uniref:Uncharacterized protein n=2 Tax=Endozoicomonas montiporae TaxID=1027273 RepID=A0A081N4D3_9GAMM|nr:hypothetical protein [Endozoicomonas montiporae]AMO57849.1 type III secretion operon protein [Endozoicomonas montiporae CL-33]KEQ13306.1 hypothetical protein GZ77_12810 [Endozoicomonas montiporae]
MSQIGQSTSTANVDVASQVSALQGGEDIERVGSGDLDGKNISASRKADESSVLKGQGTRTPDIDPPEDVKPTHLEQAKNNLNDLEKVTDKAVASTFDIIRNAKEGKLTPEQMTKLQNSAEILQDTVVFLEQLSGKKTSGAEGKKSLFASFGFSERQMDALMSLANPDTAANSLESMHGGAAALQGKKDSLKNMGFSDAQIDALMALADPDDEGNALVSMHQATGNKAKLGVLGFSQEQAGRILALLEGKTAGSNQQLQQLMKFGLTDKQAQVALAFSDPTTLQNQKVLLTNNSQQINLLQSAAAAANGLANGNYPGDVLVKALADIFVVLELMFEMSITGRKIARESRAIEYDSAKESVLSQAEDIRKAGTSALVAGVVGGTMKIASGGISLGGAAKSTKVDTDGLDANAASSAKSAATNAQLQKTSAAGTMTGSTGETVGAGFQYQVAQEQAEQKEEEALQKTHENSATSESEWMQLMQDSVKNVQSRMDEIIRTWFETLKTTTRG